MDSFETERMTARKLQENDFSFLMKLHNDEKVIITLGGARSAEWVSEYIENNISLFEKYHFGVWILFNKHTGNMMGKCIMRVYDDNGMNDVELGYALLPEYWGKGFATEAAVKMVSLAEGHYKLNELISLTLPENLASRRVMEKAGFTFEKDILHAGLPHVLYRFKRKS